MRAVGGLAAPFERRGVRVLAYTHVVGGVTHSVSTLCSSAPVAGARLLLLVTVRVDLVLSMSLMASWACPG